MLLLLRLRLLVGRRLTSSVAVLALVLVVVAAVLVLARWRSEVAIGQGPVLRGAGLAVPLTPAFEPADPGTRLFYADRGGRPVAEVTGVAVLAPGACPGVAGSSRGFVGFAPTGSGSLGDVHRALVGAWGEGLAAAAGPTRAGRETRAPGRRRTDLVARVRDDGPCQPPRVRASLLSVRVGARVSTVVLVRDQGVPGAMAGPAAEVVLARVTAARDP